MNKKNIDLFWSLYLQQSTEEELKNLCTFINRALFSLLHRVSCLAAGCHLNISSMWQTFCASTNEGKNRKDTDWRHFRGKKVQWKIVKKKRIVVAFTYTPTPQALSLSSQTDFKQWTSVQCIAISCLFFALFLFRGYYFESLCIHCLLFNICLLYLLLFALNISLPFACVVEYCEMVCYAFGVFCFANIL